MLFKRMLKNTFNQFLKEFNLKLNYEILDLNIDDYSVPIGVISIIGKIKAGSNGSKSLITLSSLSVFLREYYHLNSLIWDLSECEYEWGDGMRYLLSPFITEDFKIVDKDAWKPTVVISKNKDSFISLFDSFDLDAYVASNLKEAIDIQKSHFSS